MNALLTGLGFVLWFLVAVFWAGDEWMWLLNLLLKLGFFAFQIAVLCFIGKIILGSAFLLGAIFNSWRVPCMGSALMISISFRWLLRYVLQFRAEEFFPAVEAWHGIPYTVAWAVLVYVALMHTSFGIPPENFGKKSRIVDSH